MAKPPAFSPQIYEYLKKFQEDPTSRVFAPLAEAYRKAGLLDEAIDIAREGLRVHPNFVGGRVALARALFEKGLYSEVVDELSPVIRDVPDNLVAQKMVAESLLMLGRTLDALTAYKMLLYFSPDDRDAARIVSELEAKAYEDGSLVLVKAPPAPKVPEFTIVPAREAIDSDLRTHKEKVIQQVEYLQGMLTSLKMLRSSSASRSKS